MAAVAQEQLVQLVVEGLLTAVVKAGATRHVVAATAAALLRSLLSLDGLPSGELRRRIAVVGAQLQV